MKHCITCISCIIFLIGDTLGTDDTIPNKLNRYIPYISIVKYVFTLFVLCVCYCANAQLRLDSVLWIDAQIFGGSNMIIMSDGNYYYSWSNCSETNISFGRWHLNKDTLILNPATDTNWTLIKSISYKKRSNDSLMRIYVKDSYGHNIDVYNPHFFYYDNEEAYGKIRCNDGYIDIPVNSVKELLYSYYSFNKDIDKIVEVIDRDIEIVFNPHASMLNRRIFQVTSADTEKYIIKNDGLYYIYNPVKRLYKY